MEPKEKHRTAGYAAFILALEQLPGVGRAIVTRLLDAFGSYERLSHYPQEQILLRLKGLPRSAEIVKMLLDTENMQNRLAKASEQIELLASRHITLVAQGDATYPKGLAELPPAARPNLLYVYGSLNRAPSGGLAIIAPPPLDDPSSALVQEAVSRLAARGAACIASITSDVDVTILKRYMGENQQPRTLAIADCGLSKLSRNLRPVVRDVVRSGGTLISGFAMDHGPFSHDARERALQQVVLSDAVLFVCPHPGSFEWDALSWAVKHRQSVFAISQDETSLPGSVHPLKSSDDLDWLQVALEGTDLSGD